MSNRSILRQRIKKNSHTLEIFSMDDLVAGWEKKTGRPISEFIGRGKAIAGYIAPALDTSVAAQLVKDLGVSGEVVTKTVRGKTYVIFKGYPGTRKIFTGTRYLANHPKVIDMAIGKLGVQRSVVAGARLTLLFLVPLEIIRYILDDQYTLAKLVGTLASDVVKLGLSSAFAGISGFLVAGSATVAAGPLLAVIMIGVGASFTLEKLDQKFQITEQLIRAIEEAYQKTVDNMGGQVHQVERTLRWQLMNQLPLGKGIFY